MVGNYILDHGKPRICLGLSEWTGWMESHDIVIERTKVDPSEVVTIFTGSDLGAGFPNMPMLWETCVVGPQGMVLHNDDAVYSSLGAAKCGHFEIVKELEQAHGRPPTDDKLA